MPNFLKSMRLLDHRFRGGKETPKPTSEIYFSLLKAIPNEAWKDICIDAMDEFRTFPTPAELKSLWYSWRQNHPEKMTKPPPTECRECWSTGYLWARKLVEDLSTPLNPYRQTTLFLCAKCNNSGGIPLGARRVTRIQLEKEGYELEILADNFENPEDAKRQFLALAGSIFKSMPSSPTQDDLEERRQQQKADLDRYLADQDDLPF